MMTVRVRSATITADRIYAGVITADQPAGEAERAIDAIMAELDRPGPVGFSSYYVCADCGRSIGVGREQDHAPDCPDSPLQRARLRAQVASPPPRPDLAARVAAPVWRLVRAMTNPPARTADVDVDVVLRVVAVAAWLALVVAAAFS